MIRSSYDPCVDGLCNSLQTLQKNKTNKKQVLLKWWYTWVSYWSRSQRILVHSHKGEEGKPVHTSLEEKPKADQTVREFGFNMVASDKMAWNRSIPDTRMDESVLFELFSNSKVIWMFISLYVCVNIYICVCVFYVHSHV